MRSFSLPEGDRVDLDLEPSPVMGREEEVRGDSSSLKRDMGIRARATKKRNMVGRGRRAATHNLEDKRGRGDEVVRRAFEEGV